jgi:hypothetical protein
MEACDDCEKMVNKNHVSHIFKQKNMFHDSFR